LGSGFRRSCDEKWAAQEKAEKMEAIVLTEEQATALRAANGNSHLILEPRRLGDGRLILNVDVLEDPFFVDRGRGWAATLLAPVEIQPEVTGGNESEVEVEVDVAPGVLAEGVQRVTLSESDLV